jgi:hypothetical protein
MDLVLGLSLTSAAVRWVLVEGSTGQGDPIDRGELDIPAIESLDVGLVLHAVLNPDVIPEHRIRVIGVTSTEEAAPAAAAVVETLRARGHRNVVSVTDDAAVAALAKGVVDLTEYDDVAVCIVEPDAAFVAQVDGGEVTVAHIDRPADRADAFELTSSVIAVIDERKTQAVFVIGSDDVDVIVSSFEAIVDVPVFSAAEADLALARGAVLVAARTLDMAGPLPVPLTVRRSPRVGLISAVLAAAVVTFVVAVSIALGLNLTHDPPPRIENVGAADDSTPSAATPPPAAQPHLAYPDAPRDLAQTMVVAPPPAPAPMAAPVNAPPPAYQAPAPVYVPPPPPAQPRLRDRILGHLPIIGRFHQPGP